MQNLYYTKMNTPKRLSEAIFLPSRGNSGYFYVRYSDPATAITTKPE